MGRIQDIHVLEERIYDFIDDYIGGKYNKDFVFAIGLHCKLNVTNYYIPFSIYFFKIGGL